MKFIDGLLKILSAEVIVTAIEISVFATLVIFYSRTLIRGEKYLTVCINCYHEGIIELFLICIVLVINVVFLVLVVNDKISERDTDVLP